MRALFLCLLCGLACADADSTRLVLIGGGSSPEDALRRFAEAVDGPLLILPAATTRAERSGEAHRALFAELGCEESAFFPLPDRDAASDPELLAYCARAGGVWFPGGSQRRIAEKIVGTPLHEALHALQARGGVIGGTSAGTACQGPLMLTGQGDPDRFETGNLELLEGLDLAPGLLLDQHFVARGRLARLLSAVLEHPELLGVGIDEGTAIAIDDRGFEVLGRGWVIIYDAREARIDDAPGSQAARGVLTHLLRAGERWDWD